MFAGSSWACAAREGERGGGQHHGAANPRDASRTQARAGARGGTAPRGSRHDRSGLKKVAKSGLRGCEIVVGLCGHMAWSHMTQSGHPEEAAVETRRAVHMRKGEWHRWAIPVDYCAITHLFAPL